VSCTAPLRLFTNLFQPSFKLKSSERDGGRIKRQHHPPRTPLQQLLLATMRSCQSRLALLISGQRASAMAGDPLSWQTPEEEKRELERFLQGLQALWRQSRPLQKKPKPRQGRRSRVDPFEAHADLIPQWLEAEADVGSQELLERLIALDPERYGPQHKRTLQRRIRDWRVARVQQCLESAAVRPETKPETREKVLPGVNQNG
jgi:hypothetical protein